MAQQVRAARASRAIGATASANGIAASSAPAAGKPGQAQHPFSDAGKQLLDLIGVHLDSTAQTESLRPKREAPWQGYDVAVDEEMLTAESPAHELTIRMLATGLAERGLVLPRFDLEQLYFLVPWDRLPAREEAIREIEAALKSGHKVVHYTSNAVGKALQANEQRQIRLNRAHAEFQEQLKNSTYVQDAITSFYTAHINAPIGLVNDGLALGWKGADALGIADSPPPQLAKIPYVGEFGQKYGQTMEAGAKAGLLVVATGPLAGSLTQVGARAGAAIGSIGFGGVRVGALALQAARLSMTVGIAVDLGELAAFITKLVYTASTGTDEEREMALEQLWEVAVYGSFEYLLNRTAKAASKKRSLGKKQGGSGTGDRSTAKNADAREAASREKPAKQPREADTEKTGSKEPGVDSHAGKNRDGRGASERGGFAQGIEPAEISEINKDFGGKTPITGNPSTIASNAARYPGFFEKAASMIRDISGRHMFDNGNKRTAAEVVKRLMKRNNIVNGPTAQELERVVGQVARGELKTVAEIAKALRGY